MNSIQVINGLIWGGTMLLLFGISLCYIIKGFKLLTKNKLIMVLLILLAIMTFSALVLYNRYGICMLSVVHFFMIYCLMMLSLYDLMDKHLPLEWLIFSSIFGVLFLCLNPNVKLLETIISTLIFAGGMLLFSKLTRGGIGEGDVAVMALVSMILGWEMAMSILILSLFVVGLVGALLLLFKRVHKKATVPFVPFILVVLLIVEVL